MKDRFEQLGHCGLVVAPARHQSSPLQLLFLAVHNSEQHTSSPRPASPSSPRRLRTPPPTPLRLNRLRIIFRPAGRLRFNLKLGERRSSPRLLSFLLFPFSPCGFPRPVRPPPCLSDIYSTTNRTHRALRHCPPRPRRPSPTMIQRQRRNRRPPHFPSLAVGGVRGPSRILRRKT